MPSAQRRTTRMMLGALLLGAALLVGCRNAPARPDAATPGFCADWFHLADETAKLSAPPAGAARAGEMRKSVEATAAYLRALSDSAPDEIRGDFARYSTWWTAFADAMARVDYDLTRIAGDPGLQQAVRAASDPAFTQSSARVTAWVRDHCVPPR